MLLCFLKGLLGALGRRWFGADGLPGFWQNRGLQTACLLLVELWVFWPKENTWLAWTVSIALCAWYQFQFISRGHGACFDIGRDKNPSAETIARYNERWYHIPCDWLFDKVLKRPEAKYGFLYDFLYMSLRYTCPMLLPGIFISWWFVAIGVSVAPIYAFCYSLYEREIWLKPKSDWVDSATDWAEIIWGFNTFFWSAVIWESLESLPSLSSRFAWLIG